MTTSQERAIDVMGEANDGFTEGDVHRMAQALADAGRLIPDVDVPEPSYCVQELGDIYLGQSLEWEDYGISIVFGKRVGGDRGPELFVPEQDFPSSESVKEYAAYLLEAAKHMKKIEDLEKYGI